MFRVLFLLVFPFIVFASDGVSNIYSIGSASIKTGTNSVSGTLFGFKRHVSDNGITYAADVNYVLVEENDYGVDDTLDLMLNLGVMATDSLEIYGSYGYAIEGNADGFGWGAGLNFAINEQLSIIYEYREFNMENNSYDYTLESSSLGILIKF